MTIVNALLTVLAAGVAIPTSVVSLECLLGAVREAAPPKSNQGLDTARVVILVPAHDEEQGLSNTLLGLQEQLAVGDRILVVADNCSDGTAEVGRRMGAEVIERTDHERRGKGYAISFGIEHLRENSPDVVVIVDADCRLSPGAVRELARVAAAEGVPVQADYTMQLDQNADLRTRVSALAFTIRNRARPLGLTRLGLPCHLSGSGMAFPWSVISEAMPLGDDLAEDLLLGISLALRGHFTRYLGSARVESELPSSEQGQRVQRQRWERGHFATLKYALPRLLKAAAKQLDLRPLAIALDLSVPPLTLHVAELAGVFGLSAVALIFLGAGGVPLVIVVSQAALFALGIGLAWSRHGRQLLPASKLSAIPSYVAWKLGLYLQVLRSKEKATWVRTERTSTENPAPEASPDSTPRPDDADEASYVAHAAE